MIIQGKVWGTTSPLFNNNNVEMHYMQIKRGGYCSKHLHRHKYNRFVIMKGKLKVTVWKDYGSRQLADVSVIEANQECTVPPGCYHQFEALEETIALEIYWVALEEDDIERSNVGGMSYWSYEGKNTDETQTDSCNEAKPECNCNRTNCIACETRKFIESERNINQRKAVIT